MKERAGGLRLSLVVYSFASWTVVSAADHASSAATATATTTTIASPTGPAVSPSPHSSPALAPLEVRLANARSVKIKPPVFGLELGMRSERAHKILDKLSDPNRPPKEEGPEKEEDETKATGESEGHKILWQLAKTDYSSVYVKADEHDAIVYIQAIVRSGKEIPFAEIGELNKAPIHQSSLAAWDVVRPNTPLCRVVARGANDKANTITWFQVKRPGT
jgi:hypothetical protein